MVGYTQFGLNSLVSTVRVNHNMMNTHSAIKHVLAIIGRVETRSRVIVWQA
ncbi:MAG: hypothetical protein JSC085_000879 [Candidatus Tokpelaia sp. JSC085]|nr:MAG: hypothetical protein JSC085_000879 [Candidatus Tokpelaia sp. JSC085]